MFNLAGLLGGPQQQGAMQVDPATGFNPADQRAAAMGQMGQLGMTLLAAGQYMQPSERGRILANGAGFMGDTSASLHRMAQARAMTDSYQNAQLERARENAAIQSALADPNLSPEDKAFASANPKEFFRLRYATNNRAPTEIEGKIAALKRLGMSDEEIRQAIGQSAGRFRYFAGGIADTQTGQIRPWQVAGSGDPGQAPEPEQIQGVPQNPEKLFGSMSTLAKMWRNVRGAVGASNPDDVTTARDVTWLQQHKNDLNNVLSETFSGQQTNWTRQRSNIIADPQKFWQSPAEALGDIQMADNYIKTQIADLTEIMNSPEVRANRTMMAKARQKLVQLQRIGARNSAVMGTFAGGAPKKYDDADTLAKEALKFTGE